jgi:TetR/AcrR family transcriptional repressor of mexJK operon
MAKTVQLRAGKGARTRAGGRSRGAAKRRAILAGAKKVFLRRGFEGASMDEVALAAGVSKMTVYRHFASKEALFAGLVGGLCEAMVDGALSDGLDGLPPAEALRRFGRGFARTVFDPATLSLLRSVLAESARFPALGRLFYASGPERNIADLAAYFAARRDDPRLRIGDPREAAEEFLDHVRGYAHLRLLLGVDAAPDRRAVDRRIERAIRRVLAPS